MNATGMKVEKTTTGDDGREPTPPRRPSRRQLVVAIPAIAYLCSGLPGLVAAVSDDPRHAWGFSAAYFGATMALAVLGLAGALRGRRSLFRMGTGAAMLIPTVVLLLPGLQLSFPGLVTFRLAFTVRYPDGVYVVGVDAVPLVLFGVSQAFSRRPPAVVPPVVVPPGPDPPGKARS